MNPFVRYAAGQLGIRVGRALVMGGGKGRGEKRSPRCLGTSGEREEGGESRLELRLIAGKRLGPSYSGGFCAGSLPAAMAFMRLPHRTHHTCLFSSMHHQSRTEQ